MSIKVKAEDVKRGMVLKAYDGAPLEVKSVTLTRTSAVIETHKGTMSKPRNEELRRF